MKTLSDFIYDLTKEGNNQVVEICCYDVEGVKKLFTTEELEMDSSCISFNAMQCDLPEEYNKFLEDEDFMEVSADSFVDLFNKVNCKNKIIDVSYNPIPSIFNMEASGETLPECINQLTEKVNHLKKNFPNRKPTLKLEYYRRDSFPDITEDQDLVSRFADAGIEAEVTAVSRKNNMETEYFLSGTANLAYQII